MTILIIILSITAVPVFAAKKRVRKTVSYSGSSVSFSKAKLNRPSNSVDITFLNLDKTTKVSYELIYSANRTSQGAMGSIAPVGLSDTRSLYFGTCSKGVCTPHRNITGARLVIRTTLKSGGVNTKRYSIKI